MLTVRKEGYLSHAIKRPLFLGNTHTQTKVPVIMSRRHPYNESFQRKKALNFVNVYKQLLAKFGYSIFK